MKYWRELPYRGDGESRNSKPLRRFVNLKKQRRETAISVLIIIILTIIVFGCILFDPSRNNSVKTAGVVIGSIFSLTLIVGILSLNKFRKGYDVYISDEGEEEKSDQLEDTKD